MTKQSITLETAVSIIQSPTFWGLLIPIIAATLAWYLNELSKRKWENYHRRQLQYHNLISYLEGFYQNTIW